MCPKPRGEEPDLWRRVCPRVSRALCVHCVTVSAQLPHVPVSTEQAWCLFLECEPPTCSPGAPGLLTEDMCEGTCLAAVCPAPCLCVHLPAVRTLPPPPHVSCPPAPLLYRVLPALLLFCVAATKANARQVIRKRLSVLSGMRRTHVHSYRKNTDGQVSVCG